MVYFDDNSRSLILTSKESPDGFFFGDKDDHFWEVINKVSGRKTPQNKNNFTEEEKLKFCKIYHLALATIHNKKEYPDLIATLQEKKKTLPIYVYVTDENTLELYNKWYKKDLEIEAELLPSTHFNVSISTKDLKDVKSKLKKVLLQYIDRAFKPVYNKESKVLFLGTMPSDESVKNNFYYGNPNNKFWPTMERIFGYDERTLKDEKSRIDFCHKHHIALWDVVKECSMIKGADNTIQENADDFKCNEIEKLVKKTNITSILCTGKKAYDLYCKHCEGKVGIKAIRLNSTAGRNFKNKDDIYAEYKKELRKILK